MREKKILWITIQSVLAFLLIAVIVGNCVAMRYATRITILLEQEAYEVVKADTGSELDDQYYKSDYDSYKELISAQDEFGQLVQTEGSVLLKNEGLPMAFDGKITILGAGSGVISSGNTGFIVGGGGSGSISTNGIPSIQKVFEDAGYEVNPVMTEYYTNGAGKSGRSTGGGYVGEQPLSNMTSKERDSVNDYSDVGIIIIGRTGSEGSDIPRYQTDDPDRSFLELSQNEIDLVDFATEHFEKTIVLLNTLTTMDVSAIADKEVSIVWIGAGGQSGIKAIPDILNGKQIPSGKLVDTYAKGLMDNTPSALNQGTFTFSNVTQDNSKNYYVYAEGIYVGYRYYETRYADKVMGAVNVGDYDYMDNVVYPFGYGLSYTTFEYDDVAMKDSGGDLSFRVTVKNTGSVAAKEVVQIYMQSPYTQYDRDNGIEKSSVELVGFTKTGLIAPGESEDIIVNIPKESMRAYDAQGEHTYVVDQGSYYFAVGKDSHDALNNILASQGYSMADGMTDEGNPSMTAVYEQKVFDVTSYSYGSDGEKIENEFNKADICFYDPQFKYLSRSDWEGTYPEPYGGEDKTTEATADMLEDMKMPEFQEDGGTIMPATGQSNGLALIDLKGCDYDNPIWEELLDELSVEDMWSILSNDGSAAIQNIGKPGANLKDGPAGITGTLNGGASAFGYPIEATFASTWNLDIAHQMGNFLGEDSLISGVNGWYAPACNIHRSPFSGRNFEYYSEDGFISGKFAATVVNGAAEKGLYCFVKHFALNDQEAVRVSNCTFANEQSIRELYLKPFELAVREGGTTAIMSSYNHIGCVWSGHHKGLLTKVLRDEWGFKGYTLTDFMSPSSYEDILAGIQAGQDAWMSSVATGFKGGDNATLLKLMRESSHRILYTAVNSNSMNGISAATQIVPVTPLWKYWLIELDIVFGILFLVATFFTIRKLRKLYTDSRAEEMPMPNKKSGYYILCSIDIAAVVFGIVLELVGGLVFSKTYGVGLNLNLSPVLYTGIVFIFIGFMVAFILEIIGRIKKINCPVSHIALAVAIVALLFAIIFVALVITMPVLNPSNG